jgi:hypothetical protein
MCCLQYLIFPQTLAFDIAQLNRELVESENTDRYKDAERDAHKCHDIVA